MSLREMYSDYSYDRFSDIDDRLVYKLTKEIEMRYDQYSNNCYLTIGDMFSASTGTIIKSANTLKNVVNLEFLKKKYKEASDKMLSKDGTMYVFIDSNSFEDYFNKRYIIYDNFGVDKKLFYEEIVDNISIINMELLLSTMHPEYLTEDFIETFCIIQRYNALLSSILRFDTNEEIIDKYADDLIWEFILANNNDLLYKENYFKKYYKYVNGLDQLYEYKVGSRSQDRKIYLLYFNPNKKNVVIEKYNDDYDEMISYCNYRDIDENIYEKIYINTEKILLNANHVETILETEIQRFIDVDHIPIDLFNPFKIFIKKCNLTEEAVQAVINVCKKYKDTFFLRKDSEGRLKTNSLILSEIQHALLEFQSLFINDKFINKNKWFFKDCGIYISKYANISEDYILQYMDNPKKISWTEMCKNNPNFNRVGGHSLEFYKKIEDKIDWEELSKNVKDSIFKYYRSGKENSDYEKDYIARELAFLIEFKDKLRVEDVSYILKESDYFKNNFNSKYILENFENIVEKCDKSYLFGFSKNNNFGIACIIKAYASNKSTCLHILERMFKDTHDKDVLADIVKQIKNIIFSFYMSDDLGFLDKKNKEWLTNYLANDKNYKQRIFTKQMEENQ